MVKYASFQAFTDSERSLNLSPHAFQLVLIGLMVALLTGCAKDTDDSEEASELALYESAQSGMAAGNYKDAVARLQALEARFPFGRYAEQAQLEIIYAYYQSSQAEAARAAADRFIRLHTNHPNVDYAYYLRGLASFEEDENFLAKLFPGCGSGIFRGFLAFASAFPNQRICARCATTDALS
jgi:outer membrane protein assembly factor BamD